MDSRVKNLQAKADEVRRQARAATIDDIRTELLGIAAQYDLLADHAGIEARDERRASLGYHTARATHG